MVCFDSLRVTVHSKNMWLVDFKVILGLNLTEFENKCIGYLSSIFHRKNKATLRVECYV